MKEHFQDYGIRKWAGNDLIELQSEPLEALQKLVEPYAPCILQGCEVTENGDTITVEPGLVALQGRDYKGEDCVKIARFAGVAATTPPVYLALDCEPESRVYGDSQVKAIAYNYRAVATTQKPEKPYLEINTSGNKRLVDTLGITQKLDREGGNASDVKVGSFTADTTQDHTNIAAGMTLKELFGRIYRWFSELKALAFKSEVSKSDFDKTLTEAFNNKVDKVDGKGLVSVDSEIGNTSNPVQNKVIKEALDAKANENHTHTLASLGAAASSHTHSYLPLSGGTMTGPVVFGTASNNNKPNNYISAGGGYGVNSGKYGLKLLDFDAPDGQSGIGQDLTGYTYETTIAGCQSSTGDSHITFAKHAAGSTTYTRLAEIDGSGNFNTQGQLKENGTRVYSPNNKPTLSALGAAASSHTHSVATTNANGLMSSTDKQKLDGLSNYTLPTASSSVLGGIKTNYTTSGKNYKVSVDGSGNAYVNVPWSDTNTTYNVATTSANGLMSSDDKTKLSKIYFAGHYEDGWKRVMIGSQPTVIPQGTGIYRIYIAPYALLFVSIVGYANTLITTTSQGSSYYDVLIRDVA